MAAAVTVGYIGLGHAGYPMAACLAKKGYKLVVHDANPAARLKFVDEYPNCTLALLPGADDDDDKARPLAFEACSILITMLPNGKVVRDVLLGEKGGVAKHLQPGTVVVDTSSSSPFDTRSLGADLARDYSIALIDAPITQSALHAIDTGGATLMIGADDNSALQKVLPVLRDMSAHVFVMGGLGAGHTMKTLNNYVSVGSILALCDALVAGRRLGLDPQTMVDVMNVGTGANFSTRYAMREPGESVDSGYQLALLVKDVKIAKEVIEKGAGFETELPGLAVRYLEEALGMVEEGACHSECIRAWEQRAGVEVKKRKAHAPDHQ